MERLQQLLSHPLWQENFRQLQEQEAERVFCRHTMEHFLDVARIAYIEDLEENRKIPKVRIYAAALLHDIGRAAQYRDGTPHDQAGAQLAEQILRDCGFSDEERQDIIAAILGHRKAETGTGNHLAGLLYRADKLSRNCLFCPAEGECNWAEQKKNLKITI